jgi:hypothetical protein
MSRRSFTVSGFPAVETSYTQAIVMAAQRGAHQTHGGIMNKSLALLALPALLLTGCASGPSTTEAASAATVMPAAATQPATPKPTPTPTKTATREEQMKEIYLEGIYKSEPALRAAAAGADLVDVGQGFCKMYDGGAKGSDINKYILTAAGWAYTVNQLVAVHGAAVGVYCPKYIDKMGL